jgi:hypothetical protein
MAFAAAAFQGTPGFGQFTDAGALAKGLEAYAGRSAGVMFALALLDASIIGASAVSLATTYAIGDVLALRHSLHRKATDARGFYAVYAGLILVAAVLVLLGSDALLGLLTTAVQTLAGVLLPSATVFLLLLCNDKDVLGPWVNGRWLNLFTGAVIWVLVMLSMILTAATAFPDMSGKTIMAVLRGGVAVGLAGFAIVALLHRICRELAVLGNPLHVDEARARRATWHMPPLEALPAPKLSLSSGFGSPCCAPISSPLSPWSPSRSSRSRPGSSAKEGAMTAFRTLSTGPILANLIRTPVDSQAARWNRTAPITGRCRPPALLTLQRR